MWQRLEELEVREALEKEWEQEGGDGDEDDDEDDDEEYSEDDEDDGDLTDDYSQDDGYDDRIEGSWEFIIFIIPHRFPVFSVRRP